MNYTAEKRENNVKGLDAYRPTEHISQLCPESRKDSACGYTHFSSSGKDTPPKASRVGKRSLVISFALLRRTYELNGAASEGVSGI